MKCAGEAAGKASEPTKRRLSDFLRMRIRKSIALLLTVCLAVSFASFTVLAEGIPYYEEKYPGVTFCPEIEFYVDGAQIFPTKPAVIENSKTLVPIRRIAEAEGILVEWNEEDRTVTLSRLETRVVITVDSPEIAVYRTDENGEETLDKYTMKVSPHIIHDSTYVTLKDALVALGDTVEWHEDRTIHITTAPAYRLLLSAKDGVTAETEGYDKVPDAGSALTAWLPAASVPDGTAPGEEEPADRSIGNPGNSEGFENSEDIENVGNFADFADIYEGRTAVMTLSGFRTMKDDRIAEHAPHGLYGSVASNLPLTSVRCRIDGTDMDKTVRFSPYDNVLSENLFYDFDKDMCFSDAGLGEHTFTVLASAGGEEIPVFSYTYTVLTAEEAKIPANAPKAQNVGDTEVCPPLAGNITVSSHYGFRDYNKWEFHKGVDIYSDSSYDIFCVAHGTVVDCACGTNSGIGNYVVIQHDEGWTSLYYHLSYYTVKIGQEVECGESIGVMGNTGGNYGIHLHFQTCDGWYDGIWATQNNHHAAPHTYVPQLLSAFNYTPDYESEKSDRVIVTKFEIPSEMVVGSAYPLTKNKPYFSSENNICSYAFTVTDENGNTEMSAVEDSPVMRSDGYYKYCDVSKGFDGKCCFDSLSLGKKEWTLTVTTSLGRTRVVKHGSFLVREMTAAEKKAKEEAERKAKEEAERKAKEEAERNAENEAETQVRTPESGEGSSDAEETEDDAGEPSDGDADRDAGEEEPGEAEEAEEPEVDADGNGVETLAASDSTE